MPTFLRTSLPLSVFAPKPSYLRSIVTPSFRASVVNHSRNTPVLVCQPRAGIHSISKQIRSASPATQPTMSMSTAESTKQEAALVESSKKAAAYQAVKDYLKPEYRHVGIGSGSTVVYVVEAIAELDRDITSKMAFYPTGEQSRQLILNAGLRLSYIEDLPIDRALDVAFDGADEVDDDLNLIKGGGACLMQEKIVATSATKFVCVADFRKISPRLGTNWKKGIPIEVLPMAAERVLLELKEIGSQEPRIRSGLPGKAGPIVTDNGMLIIDAPFPPLLLPKDKESGVKGGNGEDGVWSVDALAQRLINIVGIAEIGLFHGHNGLQIARGAQKPVAAYFGMQDGGVKLMKAGDSA